MTSTGLAGSVALITGASGGIGAAIAECLAGTGVVPVLVARRADRLNDLAQRLNGQAIAADLADPAAAAQAVATALATHGRLDILINAAGLMLNGPTLETGFSAWQRMVEVNLLGLMAMTHAALPALCRAAADSPRRVADVVNISSVAGRQARATVAGYNATKFGVAAFTEAMRQEFAPRNVRFTDVAPGAVDTELFDQGGETARAYYDRFFAGIEKLHPADVAETVAWVISRPRRVAIPDLVIRPTDHI